MTTNGQSANLLRAPTGQFLGQNNSSGTYYPITNSLGSVVALTNSSGAIAQSYQYSPYGRTISSSGSTPSAFGFAGGVNVPGAGGLVHFGARFYNPSVGSWTQLDPSGQSQGYQYAGDNPINYIDGTGLNRISWVDTIVAGVGVVGVVGVAFGAVVIVVTAPVWLTVGAVGIGAAGAGYGVYRLFEPAPGPTYRNPFG